ncbi:hypothetical protein C8039_07805 [Halogeometricum sp. wsp3]|nr:hypothetical protein C8039_07805 [Halogeometricum sp. wsp3]
MGWDGFRRVPRRTRRQRGPPCLDRSSHRTRGSSRTVSQIKGARCFGKHHQDHATVRTFAENVDHAFFLVPPDYSEVSFMNSATEEMYGVTEQQLRTFKVFLRYCESIEASRQASRTNSSRGFSRWRSESKNWKRNSIRRSE